MPEEKKSIKIKAEDKEKKVSKTTKKKESTAKKKKVAKKKVKKDLEDKKVVKKVIPEESLIDSIKSKESAFAKEKVVDAKIDLSKEDEIVEDGVEENEVDTVDLKSEEVVKEEELKDEHAGGIVIGEEELENDSKKEEETSSDKVVVDSDNDGDVVNVEEVVENKINTSEEDGEIDLRKAASADRLPDSQRKSAVANVVESFEKEEKEKKFGRSIGVYKKMAYFFVFLVIILIGVVFYLTSVKVVITIIPNQEKISSSMIFEVSGSDLEISENTIKGLVEKVPVTHTSKFDATGIEVIGKDVIGTATIFNNHDSNQPLVATTRLLPPNGELFRIKETINIPAGGSVEVDIYADDPRPDVYLAPTKMTIPGLWAGLQEKIYAKTDKEITYKQQVKKHITEVDIDNSVKNIRLQFEEIARGVVENKYIDHSAVIYNVDKNTIGTEVDGADGDEVDEFEVEMSADVVVAAFDSRNAAELAKKKFETKLPNGKELVNFDYDGIEFAISDYDSQSNTVSVNALFEGRISLKDDTTVINKQELLGLSKQQLEIFISSKDEVAGVDVKFYPPFISKIPSFIELGRIQIEIKK